MEMNRYNEAMTNLKRAYEITSCDVTKLEITFTMTKYAYEYQHLFCCSISHWNSFEDLYYRIILPWKSYDLFPRLSWLSYGRFQDTIKFVLEKSLQAVKSLKSENARNHLMFCNSAMIIKMFK